MTRRLFYEDQYLREFQSAVVRRATHAGKPAVVLEATAFYPTSGGQPHDTGTINGVKVVDVIEEGGEIVHVLEKDITGDAASGAIDWDRRIDHLQQHHGQHILSEAFIRVAKADTASFHLGAETCSIDLERSYVAPEQVEAAEKLANDIVLENRETSIYYATKDEVAKLPLRKPPAVEGRIRVVHVKDFDCSACCGTHPKRTGEVGPILVLNAERGKTQARVTFVCGRRALAIARRDVAILKSAGAKLSAGRDNLDAAVDRLLEERSASNKSLQLAEKKLAGYTAREMAAGAEAHARGKVVLAVIDGKDMRYLQGLANEIIGAPGHIALLGSAGDPTAIVLARSADVAVDLKPIGVDVFKAINGKGGGSPAFQQGGGTSKDVAAALQLARSRL